MLVTAQLFYLFYGVVLFAIHHRPSYEAVIAKRALIGMPSGIFVADDAIGDSAAIHRLYRRDFVLFERLLAQRAYIVGRVSLRENAHTAKWLVTALANGWFWKRFQSSQSQRSSSKKSTSAHLACGGSAIVGVLDVPFELLS
jgi:hypothetical protein